MEIFDIVDAKGNPTGETIERSEAHAKGIRHRTAHIWVLRTSNGRTEILLQKRSSNKDSFPGRYDTSSAGHIQAGDEPMESAQRELAEELGIQADEEDLIFAGTFDIEYQKEFYGKIFHDNEIAFVYIYKGEVDESELSLQVEEVERVDWFPLQEVYEATLGHDQTFCVPIDGLRVLRKYLGE